MLNAQLNKTLLTDIVGHGTGGVTTAALGLMTNVGAEVGGFIVQSILQESMTMYNTV